MARIELKLSVRITYFQGFLKEMWIRAIEFAVSSALNTQNPILQSSEWYTARPTVPSIKEPSVLSNQPKIAFRGLQWPKSPPCVYSEPGWQPSPRNYALCSQSRNKSLYLPLRERQSEVSSDSAHAVVPNDFSKGSQVSVVQIQHPMF
jgi:hypothetical protein